MSLIAQLPKEKIVARLGKDGFRAVLLAASLVGAALWHLYGDTASAQRIIETTLQTIATALFVYEYILKAFEKRAIL